MLEALRSARIGRQNRRRKSDTLSAFADAVTHARAPYRDCTDAGHDLALGQRPVAPSPPAAIIGQLVGMGAEPSRNLGFDGLPNRVLAPLRKTAVSGSENVPGWVSSKTSVSVTAYHSFGGEVEALNTPTIRRLTLHAVTNFRLSSAENVIAFYDKRGTCENWIKEGKGTIKWTRLSCRLFAANAVRLQLRSLAYNLGNFLHTLATPEPI